MEKFLYNQPTLREQRKDLRHQQTKPEEILWQKLRGKQLQNLKFYRQYSVGPYVLDFYCPKARLATELDGESHNSADAKIYDAERTVYLQGTDIRVLRFKNEEVITDLNQVLEKISTLLLG